MICNLSAIIKDNSSELPVSGVCNLLDTDFLGEDISFPNGLYVDGKITNNTKSLQFTAKVTGEVNVHCARCRIPVSEKIEFSLSETLIRDEKQDSSMEDVIIFSGYEIDIDEIVINNFFMNAPVKYLCKEDCKGLCPTCGQDLNVGDCDCSDDEIDPRWAGLAQIIKNSQTE